MTDGGGTCGHSIRVVDDDAYRERDVPEGSLTDDGVWNCPHDAVPDGDRCIFHVPIDEKDAAAVRDAFASAIDGTGSDIASDDELARRRRTEFVDAEFGRLQFPAGSIVGDEGVGVPIYLSHATFAGDVRFEDATFARGAFFTGATFEGDANFSETTFRGDTRFNGVTFREDAAFDRTVFEEEVRSGGVTFEGEADFYRAAFAEDLNLKYAIFEGKATFWKATIPETVRFNGAEFRPLDGEFHELQELDLTNANFTDATLRDVNLEASELIQAKLFGADLRGVRLYGAVLTDSRVDDRTRFLGPPGAPPFSLGGLVRFWHKPRCVYDPRYDGDPVGDGTRAQRNRAKSTYRSIAEGASSASRPALQSLCFVNRQDIHRRTHRDELVRGLPRDQLEADGGAPASTADRTATPMPGRSSASIRRGVRATARNALYRSVKLFQWLRAELSRWTLLYGESPWRIIATGLTIVAGFALLYPLGGLVPTTGPDVTYANIAENPRLFFDSAYFSTLTFTTLGMGDYQPIGIARVLMSVQTSLGAIVVAMLVFVFGRRAAR
ncbi:MAG TPA: pentapeptide repeat-containing protein [Natronoarchaeum rubrum]|nr:pentapeptide repeat-containing protein [Natronoarchaeum rubrum]